MADLSPAAQAIHDAFWSHPNGKPLAQDCPDTDQLVAALRAVADALVANEYWDKYPAIYYRKKLFAIAAELEAQ